jgi:hypothetical protein
MLAILVAGCLAMASPGVMAKGGSGGNGGGSSGGGGGGGGGGGWSLSLLLSTFSLR